MVKDENKASLSFFIGQRVDCFVNKRPRFQPENIYYFAVSIIYLSISEVTH